eukprot:30264-Eustigmatos_ZCMA.PRE.1
MAHGYTANPLAEPGARPFEAMSRFAHLPWGHAVQHVVFLVGRGDHHGAGAPLLEKPAFQPREPGRRNVLNRLHHRHGFKPDK